MNNNRKHSQKIIMNDCYNKVKAMEEENNESEKFLIDIFNNNKARNN